MDGSLSGKTAVITGGAGILGSVLAKELLQKGVNVAICDIDEGKLNTVSQKISNNKGQISSFVCDVLDIATLQKTAQDIIRTYGQIDFLINGAGGNSPLATTQQEYYNPESKEESFFTLTTENLQKVMDLNFFGTVYPSQIFAPYIIENKQGCIINFSSMNVYTPLTKIPMYSAGKAAVANFTQWLANYLAHTGVRVNAIAPGFFDTIQTRDLWYDEQGQMLPRAKKILERTPMQRFGVPKELVGLLLFLLDNEQSGFITGATFPVDGGFLSYTGI